MPEEDIAALKSVDPPSARPTTSTPGPWTWDGKFTVGIPHVKGETFFRTNPEDARLIAASPELLDACKRLLKFNEELCADVNVSTHYPSADFARAVIAKAEGR